MTTRANMEKYLGYSIPSADNTYIDTILIPAIEDYIRGYTGRVFSVDSEATARYFDGSGQREQFIDHCIQITKVELLDTDGDVYDTIASADYFTYPLNSTPIYSIYFEATRTPRHRRAVKVTAKWGDYATVPEDIQYVATVLASTIYKSAQNSNIKSEKVGEYSVTYGIQEQVFGNSAVKEMLDRYKITTSII